MAECPKCRHRAGDPQFFGQDRNTRIGDQAMYLPAILGQGFLADAGAYHFHIAVNVSAATNRRAGRFHRIGMDLDMIGVVRVACRVNHPGYDLDLLFVKIHPGEIRGNQSHAAAFNFMRILDVIHQFHFLFKYSSSAGNDSNTCCCNAAGLCTTTIISPSSIAAAILASVPPIAPLFLVTITSAP